MPIYLIVLKKHLETCKTKQIKCRIFWQETVRKLIDGLERLGYGVRYWTNLQGNKLNFMDLEHM